MNATILSIVLGVVGIISTLIAWKFNPRRTMYQQIDEINEKLTALEKQRDEALARNDSDFITRIAADIVRLRAQRKQIFQRLG